MVSLIYLHFIYMHESRFKIKEKSVLPYDTTWLPPPPNITSSQITADMAQLHFSNCSLPSCRGTGLLLGSKCLFSTALFDQMLQQSVKTIASLGAV